MTRKSRRESDSSTRLPLHWVKCIKDIDCIPCMPSKDLISMWTFVFEGVFMAMWVEYLILASPSAFPWFYLVCVNFRFLKIVNGWSIYPLFLFSILLPNPRWLWYFWCCWDTQPTARSTTTSSCSTSATSCKSLWSRKPFSSLQPPVLGRPGSKPTLLSGQESVYSAHLLIACFVPSHGPIAIAILAWQNSMVFHSLDKMTSFYIHIMPPLTCYMQVLASVFNIYPKFICILVGLFEITGHLISPIIVQYLVYQMTIPYLVGRNKQQNL